MSAQPSAPAALDRAIVQLANQFSNDLASASGLRAADIMTVLRVASDAQLDLLRTSGGWAALSAHITGDPLAAIVPGLH